MTNGLGEACIFIFQVAGVPEIKDLKEAEKKQQEENRDLALEIVSNRCKAIKAEYTIVKLR